MDGAALVEVIECYTRKLIRQNINPGSLPPCIGCQTDSSLFKPHCKRKRVFNVVVALKVITIISWLLRFMCPECRKTVTHYPDFALPHKHYAVSSISSLAKNYLEKPEVVYDRIALSSEGVPAKDTNGQSLFGSTAHRWITTIGSFDRIRSQCIEMIQDKDPSSSIARDLISLSIPKKKYRSEKRKKALLNCMELFAIEKIFKKIFRTSIFTNVARAYCFS